ncbi:MAG: hypothetical protein ACYDH6_08575 [Acidimicrobiales bacterium]
MSSAGAAPDQGEAHDGKWHGDQRLRVLREGLTDTVGFDLLGSMDSNDLPEREHEVGALRHVGVVGVGFAGMARAYFLSWLGFDVMLHQARYDYGDRVRTNSDCFAHWKVKFGAELIGWNHAVWRGLPDTFGCPGITSTTLRRTRADLGNTRVVRYDGAETLRREVEQIVEQLAEVSGSVNPYRPWDIVAGDHAPAAGSLDASDTRSLAEWPDEQTVTGDARTGVESRHPVGTAIAEMTAPIS